VFKVLTEQSLPYYPHLCGILRLLILC